MRRRPGLGQGRRSLLLITDHAPMGSAAQCLAKQFSVSMSTGATRPVQSEEPIQPDFQPREQLLGDHPITRGRDDSERVNRMRTFTGTSVKGPEGSVPILKLADTAVDLSSDGQAGSAAGGRRGLPSASARAVSWSWVRPPSFRPRSSAGDEDGDELPGDR